MYDDYRESDEEYDRRADARDEYAAEMAEEKGRRYKYHCSDRMCGASDCGTCRNGAPPWEVEDAEEAAESAERSWLANSGYDFDGDSNEWSKHVHARKHVCRRDHADGTVRKGDAYTVNTWRYISDEDGDSRLSHRKSVTKRFGTGTVLAAPWSSTDAGGGAVTFGTNAPKVIWVSRPDAETLGLTDGDDFDSAGLGAFEHNTECRSKPTILRTPLYKIVHAGRSMNLIPADAKTPHRFVAKQSLIKNPAGGYPVEAHVTLEYLSGFAIHTPSPSDIAKDYADPEAFSRAKGHTIRIFDVPKA